MTPELTEEQQGVENAPTTSPESTRSSPGTLIRRARERVRMTPEELAGQTKLTRGTLEALERDDFKVLMEPVYVRGYYRKCAKVLGIAEKDLVDSYEAMVAPRAPEAPAKLRLASGSELGSGSRLPLALAAGAALIAVIVLSLIWFARGEVNQAPTLPEVAKVEVTVPVENKTEVTATDPATATDAAVVTTPAVTVPPATVPPALPALTAPVAAAPVVVAPVAPAITKPAAPPAAPVVPHAAPSTTPAVVSVGNASLTLRFNITSWARVDDANGKTLVNGLVRAGEKQTLTAPAPFAVFLGNAPGVSVDINGKMIDLGKYTAQNNTARFSAAP
jgi:cytoskeleton protein RodZ